MSFLAYSDYVKDGDIAILYIGSKRIVAIEVKETILNKHNELVENVFQTNYGALKVKSLVGKRYGSKIFLKGGYIYVMYPTTELWTITLSHRTQIVYTWDINVVLFQLDLCPGSVVIESGTGSGSVTHSLAKTVYPNGHVHTFEYHKERSTAAVNEFESHGLSNVVTVYNQDVYVSGFKQLNNIADAVFLDLPLPWIVIPHLLTCFKQRGGRFASFCPCIEQVQSTCAALREHGFVDIDTVECLQREYDLVTRDIPIAGYKKIRKLKDVPPRKKVPVASSSGNAHGNPNEDATDNGVIENDADLKSGVGISGGETIANGQVRRKVCLCPDEMAGHTGYITFASFPPAWIRQQQTLSSSTVNIETVDEEPKIIS